MAERANAERLDEQPPVELTPRSHTIADARSDGRRGPWQSLVLTNGNFATTHASQPTRAPADPALADERRRLERDLHDGVQNELVALIVALALAGEDPDAPPALREMLAALEARAQAALDSVRNIARGIYPPLLADFGLANALRAQATHAPVDVSIHGAAPRGSENAEEAVYFACSEAIQNVAKHAGRHAQVTLRMRHSDGSLAVRVADDGRGFDPGHTPHSAGLHNIRDRIEDLGGTVRVASRPEHGTVLTISMPWPAPAGRLR